MSSQETRELSETAAHSDMLHFVSVNFGNCLRTTVMERFTVRYRNIPKKAVITPNGMHATPIA